MTLRQKQSKFAHLSSLLILHINECGYEVTHGGTYRKDDPRCHGMRLAIDLNLFRDGKYLTKTESHAIFGAYWKTLDPLCRWGGDFKKRDGNHYSMTHGGKS